jgi:ABC-type transporter Mla MlaB component
MPPPIFAHLGHWYVSLPVFMGPVLLLLIALKIQTWRERRDGSHRSRKGLSVSVTREGDKTIVAVSGPLDYPALVDVEVELGRADDSTPELLLDLRRVTSAEEQSAWLLCDALGQVHDSERVSVLVGPERGLRALKAVLVAEGVSIVEAALTDPPS